MIEIAEHTACSLFASFQGERKDSKSRRGLSSQFLSWGVRSRGIGRYVVMVGQRKKGKKTMELGHRNAPPIFRGDVSIDCHPNNTLLWCYYKGVAKGFVGEIPNLHTGRSWRREKKNKKKGKT